MIYAYCIDKKIENGNITEYKLKDFEGNIQVLKSGVLKSLIDDGTICVINLTLTSDNKLRTHAVPTLNNLLKPYQGEETKVNLNQVLNDNRALLGDIEANNCYLYKHKLFYVNGSLNVLNTSTQETLRVKNNNNDSFLVKNIIYIPNNQYLNIFLEAREIGLDYFSYYIYHIIYDIYTDYYTIKVVYYNSHTQKEYLYNHYAMGVNDIITLKDKNDKLLPTFILFNKTKSTCYTISAPSKEAMIEFVNKIKNFEKHGFKFDVNVYIDGVELELENYIIKIDKKTKSGDLIRMR